MLRKNLNLLFLSAILFLGIIQTFARNNEISSDIQIRKKRVIDLAGESRSLIPIEEAGYIVNIQRRESRHCLGSIISNAAIITVAHCVEGSILEYKVLAGSHILGAGSHHNVTHKIVHEYYNPSTFENDVALLLIYPYILNGPISHPIQLYHGTIQSRTLASIVGWGCPLHSGHLSSVQNLLQAIRVPLIRYDRCASNYNNIFHINEKNICSLDPIGNKRCGVGDFGAPLVIDRQLVGMYIWSGTILGHANKPDVFIYLNHNDYREWISRKLHEFVLHLTAQRHWISPVHN